MRNKLRNAISAATVAALTLPALAMAQWNPGGAATGANLSDATFGEILNAILKWVLGLLGAIAVIMFVVAGVMYVTAAGDEDRIGTAKKIMTYSIIGLVVALIGYILVQVVSTLIFGQTGGI